MKKKIVKFSFFMAAMTAMGVGIVKTSLWQQSPLLLSENVEALSDISDEGGITLEFCVKSHSSSMFATGDNYECAEGTTLQYTLPTTPMGTIYGCSGPKGKSLPTTSMGYCYLRQ